jgi:DNA polymerase III epsilon subunit-like protein
MRPDDSWVLIDTETTGLKTPIYPVEIAAQRMRGWSRYGEGFRALLNFEVPIERGAQQVHGYTREFLRKNGKTPAEGLGAFQNYVLESPIVSYNLSYDLNRVLVPTIKRMGLKVKLKRGFCALDLARNLAPSLPNHRLETVVKTFNLASSQEHHAMEDVILVAKFLGECVGPHLEKHGIQGFSTVASCASGEIAAPPLNMNAYEEKNEPFQFFDPPSPRITNEIAFAIGELKGICKMIALDGKLHNEEFNFLCNWLGKCPYSEVSPISDLRKIVRESLTDGTVTIDEQRKLIAGIEAILRFNL